MVNKGIIKIAVALLMGVWLLGSCSDEIDESNLYTFTGETIEDFLSNREDYSSFSYIIDRAGLTSRLSAYGTYTCFAPNNAAIAEYIDSLYNDDTNMEHPHNGMTENSLEGLSDSLCQDIALFHLANTEVKGVYMSNGMTINTMLGRDINTAVDSITGSTTINSYSSITTMDNELENGVLHEINRVIRRSNALIAGEMEKHSDMSLFMQALKLTGLADSLSAQKKKLTVPGNAAIDKFYCPEECPMGYTIFIETDEVFKENGINNIEQLIEATKEWYGDCAKSGTGWYDYMRNNGIEVSTGTDYSNPYNTLNMFLRYHILKFKASYDKLNYSYNEVSKVTLYDYYETLLPYTLIKIEQLSGQRYINPYYTNNTLTNVVAELGTSDIRHPVTSDNTLNGEPTYPYTFVKIQRDNIQALNGYLHPINRILRYGELVPKGVLNERLRFDESTFFWEINSSNLRCASAAEIKALNGGVSGTDVDGRLSGNYVRCPEDFFENMRIYNGDNTCLLYMPGQEDGWKNLQGDEFNCVGAYDFAFRLPPVPDGTYELRIGYTAETYRGMVQFYIGNTSELSDMQALDIPLDMRHVNTFVPSTAWKNADGTLVYDAITGWTKYEYTDDQGVESDGAMRNKGYMRGLLYFTEGGKGGSTLARSHTHSLRRILVRQQFKQGEYWIRCKNVLKSTSAEFHLDYIEMCPEHVYNNPTYAEDMY